MREGYKETSVGVIPEDWELDYLGNISELITKGTTPTTYGYSFVKQGISFVKIESILKSGYIDKSKFNYIDEEANNALSRSTLKENDILFSIAGALGRTAIVREKILPANTNQALAIIRIGDNLKIKLSYLYHFLRSNIINNDIKRINVASAQPNLSLKNIADFKIPLPPLPEQEKIASILTTVDDKIESIDKQIESATELKKGLMQKLFQEGIGHTEFKDSPVGRIPAYWEVKKLGYNKEVQLMGGYAFSSNDSKEDGIRWLKIANVGHNEIKWNDVSFLPESFSEKHPDYLLNVGDLVIAMTRPLLGRKLKVATISELDQGCLLNQRVGKFLISDKFDSSFIFYIIQSDKFIDDMLSKLLGSDPPNISSAMIESISIVVPPLEEQQQIADILTCADDKISVLKEKKEAYTELKKGLMQKLLTGEVRVKVDA